MTKTFPSDTSRKAALTYAQATIIDRFASIEAEFACLLRETKRTRNDLQTKKARRKDGRKR